MHNGKINNKAVNTLIWEIDAIECKREYLEMKIPQYHQWIDIGVRNTFHKVVGIGTLKCITGFNHYGYRDEKINKGMVDNKCPRCEQIES